MYKPDRDPKRHPHGPTKGECCTDARCESGLRNQYFEGKRLTAESFRVEQRYQLERRRLLNRAIHGWGVVYGYGIKVAPPDKLRREKYSDRLQVLAGLALDPCGRELLQVGVEPLSLEDIVVLDGGGRRIDLAAGKPPDAFAPAPKEPAHPAVATPAPASLSPGIRHTIEEHLADQRRDDRIPQPKPGHDDDIRRASCWLLSVHYAEQEISPTTIHDPCSCERSEWDQVCETVRYSLRPIDCVDCCAEDECELHCECSESPCCVAHMLAPREREEGCRLVPRGGCSCLCEHLTGLDPGPDCCPLCEIEEPCGRVRVDLRHGVPLACLMLLDDDCGEWRIVPRVEACGPRRLVKRNDLLFDLVRGCDLAHISRIGWGRWHRSETAMPFPDFMRSFGREDSDRGANVAGQYTVEFSRPVLAETVRVDCFSMRILFPERGEGWRSEHHVPILDVDLFDANNRPVPKNNVTPATLATSATLVFDSDWVGDAVSESSWTLFRCEEALVEIEILGDFILDCNGQAIDANAVGLCAFPTGNGTPGGTFHSRFHVAVPQEHRHVRGAGNAPSAQGAQP